MRKFDKVMKVVLLIDIILSIMDILILTKNLKNSKKD